VSAVDAHLALGYDRPEMRRVVNVMQVAFWASVPLFAVYLAVTPRDGRLGWTGEVLWWVVLASSAFLTARTFPPVPGAIEGTPSAGSDRRCSEALAHPVVLFLAVYLVASQIGDSIF
jgi:hypothetical protein